MSKFIIRNKANDAVEAERNQRFANLPPEERLLSLIRRNRYASMMKGQPLKQPLRKGLVIEKKQGTK